MADEQPKIDIHQHHDEPNILIPSKKALSQLIMPPVGVMIGDKYKVIYVHSTKMRFTATGAELPKPGQNIVLDGRVFQVEYVDESKHRFNAQFLGFEKPAEQTPANAPEPETADIAKIVE